MFLFYVLSFFKRGALFKGDIILRKYGIYPINKIFYEVLCSFSRSPWIMIKFHGLSHKGNRAQNVACWKLDQREALRYVQKFKERSQRWSCRDVGFGGDRGPCCPQVLIDQLTLSQKNLNYVFLIHLHQSRSFSN